MPRLYLDGQLYPSDQPLFTSSNRAFRYGDALFESIRMFEGKMPFLELHYDRLKKGMDLLNLEYPGLTIRFIQDAIRLLIPKEINARIRLQLFRKGAGLYTPQNNTSSLLIEWSPLSESQFQAHPTGISAGLYQPTDFSFPSSAHIKTANALPYILAAQERLKRQLDDLLILNEKGLLVEACASNVILETPEAFIASPYGIQGTLQRWILEHSNNLLGATIQVRDISKSDIFKAKALFLTNAIQGVRWIQQLETTSYGPGRFNDIVQILNHYIAHGTP